MPHHMMPDTASPGPIPIRDSAPQVRPEWYAPDVSNRHGTPPALVVRTTFSRSSTVFTYPRPRTMLLTAGHLHQSATHVVVAGPDGSNHFLNGDLIFLQTIRIDIGPDIDGRTPRAKQLQRTPGTVCNWKRKYQSCSDRKFRQRSRLCRLILERVLKTPTPIRSRPGPSSVFTSEGSREETFCKDSRVRERAQ